MNVLDHFILKVHSVTDMGYFFGNDRKYVKVDYTFDCYGIIERTTDLWLMDTWEEI